MQQVRTGPPPSQNSNNPTRYTKHCSKPGVVLLGEVVVAGGAGVVVVDVVPLDVVVVTAT